MTAPPPPPSADPAATPDVTWRDAVTPLGRASRRRWTLCYVALMALLAACVVDDSIGLENPDAWIPDPIPLILFLAPAVVLGMLRRGTRRITARDHPDLDERDVATRNSAYRIAFPLLGLATVAGLVLLATHLAPPGEHYVQTRHGWFVQSVELIALGGWIGLWAIFLPTGVLAWREPDALEPESGGRGLPEALRDGLLGFALAASVAISLIAEGDDGLWVFVVALALLGALARRAAGQPAMSRQRKWRVAIGIVLIVLLWLAAVINAHSGGGSGAQPPDVQRTR